MLLFIPGTSPSRSRASGGSIPTTSAAFGSPAFRWRSGCSSSASPTPACSPTSRSSTTSPTPSAGRLPFRHPPCSPSCAPACVRPIRGPVVHRPDLRPDRTAGRRPRLRCLAMGLRAAMEPPLVVRLHPLAPPLHRLQWRADWTSLLGIPRAQPGCGRSLRPDRVVQQRPQPPAAHLLRCRSTTSSTGS